MQWQSKIIASLEQARKACQATYGDIQAFRSQLSIITVHTDDDQKLADILRQAPQAAELNEDGLVQQISAWNSVIDSLNKMSPSATFKPVHQEAVKKTTGIKAGWEEVVAAHQAKDKAKYTAAVAALGDSYDELDALTTIGESSIATLAADLQNKYQLTFG